MARLKAIVGILVAVFLAMLIFNHYLTIAREKKLLGKSESEVIKMLGSPVGGVDIFTPNPGQSSFVLEFRDGVYVGFDRSGKCISFSKKGRVHKIR